MSMTTTWPYDAEPAPVHDELVAAPVTRDRLTVGDRPSRVAQERLALIELAMLRAGSRRAARRDDVSFAPLAPAIVEPIPIPMPGRLVRPGSGSSAYRTVSRPVRAPARPTVVPGLSAPVRTRTRLTTRGGYVVAVLVAAAVVAVAVLTNLVGGPAGAPPAAAYEVSVSVQTGDTLYSIARRVAPTADPEQTVAAILAANDLTAADATAIVPGQRVIVPVG